MNYNKDNIEEIYNLLNDDINLIDKLSDEQVDLLIEYLETEIERKEKLLESLKNN